MKAYSLNDEDYFTDFSELVGEALDNGLAVGSTYYERDCRSLVVNDVFKVWRLVDQLEESFYEEVGDYYSCPVTAQQVDELNEMVSAWINKYMTPSDYIKFIGEKREVAFTEEDLQE